MLHKTIITIGLSGTLCLLAACSNTNFVVTNARVGAGGAQLDNFAPRPMQDTDKGTVRYTISPQPR